MAEAPAKFVREEVIQWVFRIRHSNVPTVGPLSPLAMRNRNNSSREAILTSPSVASNAVRQGKHASTETVATAMVMIATATGRAAKCSLQYALSVARKLKYRSSPVRADQCIAVIATVKSEWAYKLASVCKMNMGWVYPSLCSSLQRVKCHVTKSYNTWRWILISHTGNRRDIRRPNLIHKESTYQAYLSSDVWKCKESSSGAHHWVENRLLSKGSGAFQCVRCSEERVFDNFIKRNR